MILGNSQTHGPSTILRIRVLNRQCIVMTEPNSEPQASRIGRWLRRVALAVLLLVWLAGIAICVGVYRDPRWGLDARVSITGVCLVFALLLTLLWFCFCTRYRWQLRLGVLGAVLAVGLLLPARVSRRAGDRLSGADTATALAAAS